MFFRPSVPEAPRIARSAGVVAALGAAALIIGTAGPAGATAAKGNLCTGHNTPGAHCALGKGRRTAGGGGKVSHAGWPAVTGIRWSVTKGTKGRTDGGTHLNDELLGSHGGDTLSGGDGNDILWGDQSPVGNDEWQHDTLSGGDGQDWIYSSHGVNTIDGGAGNDHIFVHYGKGTVDCGSGYDVVKVTLHPKYTFRNCEKKYR